MFEAWFLFMCAGAVPCHPRTTYAVPTYIHHPTPTMICSCDDWALCKCYFQNPTFDVSWGQEVFPYLIFLSDGKDAQKDGSKGFNSWVTIKARLHFWCICIHRGLGLVCEAGVRNEYAKRVFAAGVRGWCARWVCKGMCAWHVCESGLRGGCMRRVCKADLHNLRYPANYLPGTFVKIVIWQAHFEQIHIKN